jgi:hypothetical protein
MYALLSTVALVMIPRLQAPTSAMVTCGSVAGGYLLIALFVGPGTVVETLPYAVAEAALVGLCVYFARRVALALGDFEASVDRLVLEGLPLLPEFLGDAQRKMQLEVRRARSHERPVSVLTLAPPEALSRVQAEEFIAEVQEKSMQRYVLGRIASVLSHEMRQQDVVAVRDGYFVTLLPETTLEQADELARRMQELCSEELQLDVKIGTASFPDQEVTFRRLLGSAEASMRNAASRPAVTLADVETMPDQWRPERRGAQQQ